MTNARCTCYDYPVSGISGRCPACLPPLEPEPLDLAPYRLPDVIIPQFPTLLDRQRRVVRRDIDLSDAERYGRVRCLVGDGAKPFDADGVDQLDAAVQDTSADDWLLCLGNPTLIAVAAASFALLHGRLNVLQYQRWLGRYEAITFTFTEDGTAVENRTAPPEGDDQ